MKELFEIMPQVGSVQWIGIRPSKREPLNKVESVRATKAVGLDGDHFNGGEGAKRQVTLIQSEHIGVVGHILGKPEIDPGLLRRNIVVSGINLLALKEQYFRIGNAVFYGTGNCPPCSRMEENLGAGGYNSMRGHGGITAYVVEDGEIELGSAVELIPNFETI